MRSLAIDTSTEACSIAYYDEGEIVEFFLHAKQRHSSVIFEQIHMLTKAFPGFLSSLDCLILSQGPGSFTGLRIGASVAQGIASAFNLPIVPISTLSLIAAQAKRLYDANAILAVLDARMGEYYFAKYEAMPHIKQIKKEAISSIDNIYLEQNQAWELFGTGLETISPEWIKKQGIRRTASLYPRAFDLVELGVQAYQANPDIALNQAKLVYIRDNVAKKKGEK